MRKSQSVSSVNETTVCRLVIRVALKNAELENSQTGYSYPHNIHGLMLKFIIGIYLLLWCFDGLEVFAHARTQHAV